MSTRVLEGGRRRLRPRDVLIGLCSVVILVIAASYVLAPSREAIAMSVSTGDQVESAQAAAAQEEIVYGRVTTAKGVKISKLTIAFTGPAKQKLAVEIGSGGTYQAVFQLPAGQYQLTLSMQANGSPLSATRSLRVTTGTAYDVSAKITAQSVFTLLPVSSY